MQVWKMADLLCKVKSTYLMDLIQFYSLSNFPWLSIWQFRFVRNVFRLYNPSSVKARPNEALFLRLGLLSTLVRHENGSFRKRSSNRSNLKTPASRFSANVKHFENGSKNDDVMIMMWFFPQILIQNDLLLLCYFQIPLAYLVWTENIGYIFRVKPPFSNTSCVEWTGPKYRTFYARPHFRVPVSKGDHKRRNDRTVEWWNHRTAENDSQP